MTHRLDPLLALLACLAGGAGAADAPVELEGRWRGVHTTGGRAFHDIIRVRKSGGAYTARGLVFFGVSEEQAILATKGTKPRSTVPGAMVVLQLYAVRLTDGTLTFRGTKATSLFGGRGGYAPDTFSATLTPPGAIAGEAADARGTQATFQLAHEDAVARPLPLELAKGKTHQLACLDTARYHYTCHIPRSYDPETPAPVLVNCSPGGRAKPLSTKMGDELGWIMVGLTESKNGPIQPSCENRDAVLFDLRRRFNVHPRRLYFSGFSGGARMASWSGVAYPEWCAGVICIGAGYLQVPPPLHQPVFFIVGKTDMNNAEVTKLHPAEARKGRKTKLVIHPGGHSWGRKEDHEQAVRWLDALYQGADGRERPRKDAKGR